MKNFEEFLKEIQEGSLKEEYEKALGGKDEMPINERVDNIIKFAREHGYDISIEDLTLADADRHTLDDKELAKVSGGGHGGEFCIFDYGCGFAWNTCRASNECHSGYNCESSLN